MSTRYRDTDRDFDRRVREDREANEREIGRGLRQDVRDTGREIRSAGGDIIGSWCSLWGNLLSSLGETITPQQQQQQRRNSYNRDSSRRGGASREASVDYETNDYNDYEESGGGQQSQGGSFGCLEGGDFNIHGGHFILRCGGSGGGSERSSSPGRNNYDDDSDETRVSGRYSGRNTEVDVNARST